MSVTYASVQWNRNKRIYDAALGGGVSAFLAIFFVVGKLAWRGEHAISDEILAMRALGACAFVMLNLILCIGPLVRLDRRFLPLLYNRRHFGVAMFLVALLHAALATGFYHGFGAINPILSLLSINTGFGALRSFPYQLPGLAALLILFIMASTSHDFWLKFLSPTAWKRIHMLVYAAYGLVILHVAAGALQSQRSPILAALVAAAATTVATLHLLAGCRERDRDTPRPPAAADAWLDAGPITAIPDSRGIAVCPPSGERIAVFRVGNLISATSAVCAHQGGPLGEGKIIDGCLTCPWHGWQYSPTTGQSPPPFKEKIATFRVRLVGDRIQVDPRPLAPGTPVDPAPIPEFRHD